MAERGSYLISYDVIGARQGQRVQRHLRKHASMLLESLYLYQGMFEELQDLTGQLRKLAGRSAEDVVAWRVRKSMPLLTWGTACQPEGVTDFRLPLVRHLPPLENAARRDLQA